MSNDTVDRNESQSGPEALPAPSYPDHLPWNAYIYVVLYCGDILTTEGNKDITH